MGRISDSPGLDEGRPAPAYGDPVGETAIKRLIRNRPLTNWHITGPGQQHNLVRDAHRVHAEGEGFDWLPEISTRPLQLNLMPELASAVLRFIEAVAEPAPSRSGSSYTFRLKKNAAAILADHDGNTSPGNS